MLLQSEQNTAISSMRSCVSDIQGMELEIQNQLEVSQLRLEGKKNGPRLVNCGQAKKRPAKNRNRNKTGKLGEA